MARPLRIERAGAWYHVTARGSERRAIYRDNKDRAHWLELLGEAVDLWRLVVHGYVLMDNHFDLLLETVEPNLSRAMHWLNTSYIVWFNRRHGRVGPLFQGVYKAILVDRVGWGLMLSRHLHLNPVRTMQRGLGKKDRRAGRLGVRGKPLRRMVQQRIEKLRNYRWSSYRAYIGLEKQPAWLECGSVLDLDGKGARAQQQKSYQQYVEDAVRKGLEESPWEQLKGQVYLGSQQTWEKFRKTVKAGTREQTQGRSLVRRPSFAEIIAVVEELKGEKWRNICDRRSDWGRELALYLGRRLSVMKLRDLGQEVGGADYAAVSIAIKRFEARLSAERKLAQIVQQARARLIG
jgi:REP element-mobilizing transposase RayT